MPKTSSKKSVPERARELPWGELLGATVVVGRRFASLSARDRARLLELVRSSRGWPPRLAERERSELRKLLGKLDARAMARELGLLVRASRRRRIGKR
jgi:hypothetical protein